MDVQSVFFEEDIYVRVIFYSMSFEAYPDS